MARFLSDEVTAPEMARDVGIDPKTFRHALRKAGLAWHSHGASWTVRRGGAEHADMRRVLKSVSSKAARASA